MIITLEPGADAQAVRRTLAALGQWVESSSHVLVRDSHGATVESTQLSIAAHSAPIDVERLASIAGVAGVAAARSEHPRVDAIGPTIDVRGTRIGGPSPVLIAGPCAVESEARVRSIAAQAARAGASFLRGGAFKPRTSPYAFQGHGENALQWMRRAADAHGLGVVTEVLSESDVGAVHAVADMLQIGSRNMQNFALLKAVGRTGSVALLKRGMSATVEEWLLAGEYLLVHGARGVVFCERGVRGFDPVTRNLLDLGAVAHLAHAVRVPVIVDPSHATGRRDLVLPLARAALAAGAAGVMIEMHDDPGHALSDGPQALLPDDLATLARAIGVRPNDAAA